jgi:lipopolysaccharide transport system ATP-binding protein
VNEKETVAQTSRAGVVLRVEELGVRHCRNLKTSLWAALRDIAAEFFPPLARRNDGLGKDEFWAAQNISFSLEQGQCLGLIGPNGAGKSTVLKVLAGILKPDRGRVLYKGRIGSLLELGTGFSSVLTGRENIFVNGIVLGLSREEIQRRLDEIIDFAEISHAIDAPVRTYSTGMALRLAFAVAIQMAPDILLLDEVLAVGDVGFRSKCYRAMQKVLDRSAVVFVSHSMPQIARLCSHVMVLNQGQVCYFGDDVAAGIEVYYREFPGEESQAAAGGEWSMEDVHVSSPGTISCRLPLCIEAGQPLEISGTLHVQQTVGPLSLGVLFHDREHHGVAQCSPEGFLPAPQAGQGIGIRIHIPHLPFNPGRYWLSFLLHDEGKGRGMGTFRNAAEIQIHGHKFGMTPVQLHGEFLPGSTQFPQKNTDKTSAPRHCPLEKSAASG